MEIPWIDKRTKETLIKNLKKRPWHYPPWPEIRENLRIFGEENRKK